MRLFIATVFVLIASAACKEFFVTSLYSDSECSGAMIGRRATSFFQPFENCSTTLMYSNCTEFGDNYALQECVTEPDWTPEISWVTFLLYESQSCTDAPYAYYMGIPDVCLFYDQANTFTVTPCEGGSSNFTEGSNGCDYMSSGASESSNIQSTCTPSLGLGFKVICPGDYVPTAPTGSTPSGSTPGSTPTGSNTPTSGPSSSNSPSKTPAKSSDATALCASALIFIAAIAL